MNRYPPTQANHLEICRREVAPPVVRPLPCSPFLSGAEDLAPEIAREVPPQRVHVADGVVAVLRVFDQERRTLNDDACA